jgi:hypothetical protein
MSAILENHLDAELVSSIWRGDANLLAVAEGPSLQGLNNTRYRFHQGRFASAVVSQQGQDLASPHLEINALQRSNM